MRIGYVPEHFSTPLFMAVTQKFYEKHGFAESEVEFLAFPMGSGHMIEALKEAKIDVAIGLTEAFIAGVAKGSDFYRIVGTYVKSPLCWAISTGYQRSDINSVADIKDGKIGVSRIGSGSYVMSFVLAHEQKWLQEAKTPFDFKVQGKFEDLRRGVNSKESDAFMWEHFTTKKYYDSKEIKKIGDIYTPWPSWVVSAHKNVSDDGVGRFLEAVDDAIVYFNNHAEEAVEYIASNLDYTAEDAQEWLKTVQFVTPTTKGVDRGMVEKCVSILIAAGVVPKDSLENMDLSGRQVSYRLA